MVARGRKLDHFGAKSEQLVSEVARFRAQTRAFLPATRRNLCNFELVSRAQHFYIFASTFFARGARRKSGGVSMPLETTVAENTRTVATLRAPRGDTGTVSHENHEKQRDARCASARSWLRAALTRGVACPSNTGALNAKTCLQSKREFPQGSCSRILVSVASGPHSR